MTPREDSARAPVFIGGMFKSGISLPRAMLGQHRNIASGLETYWFDVDLATGQGRNGEPLAPYLVRLATYYGMEVAEVERLTEHCPDAETFVDPFTKAVAEAGGR